MTTFHLPAVIADLVSAKERVRKHYQAMLDNQSSDAELRFTFDGNLVGDIGEALAAQLFGVRLINSKSHKGIDGHADDGRTVQVKATGTGRGPAFRCLETKADHLIFFDLDLVGCKGEVVFNGPEHYATAKLPEQFSNQRSLTALQIRAADMLVDTRERLRMKG